MRRLSLWLVGTLAPQVFIDGSQAPIAIPIKGSKPGVHSRPTSEEGTQTLRGFALPQQNHSQAQRRQREHGWLRDTTFAADVEAGPARQGRDSGRQIRIEEATKGLRHEQTGFSRHMKL